jgi:hypothetical protein
MWAMPQRSAVAVATFETRAAMANKPGSDIPNCGSFANSSTGPWSNQNIPLVQYHFVHFVLYDGSLVANLVLGN